MSALGQKQTCAAQEVMSALPPKADICGATRDVRFVPIADIARHAAVSVPWVQLPLGLSSLSEESPQIRCEAVGWFYSQQYGRGSPFQKNNLQLYRSSPDLSQ